jgi:hypothetical protein
MSMRWVLVSLALLALGVVLWASDRITYEGERTIYTVRCEGGTWNGLRCTGTMVAGDRYRFKASVSKQEVLHWIVSSPEPSGKYGKCKVKNRGNWSCEVVPGEPGTITHEMVDGRPTRDAIAATPPIHAVPKWEWWVLDAGIHLYTRAGY